jgi:membrane protease YdiL (CAAX protease family)
MLRPIRPFFITLACVWIALLATALVYSSEHPSSHWIMTAALPAFLAETVFYLGSVFEGTRFWFDRLGSTRTKATLLWISALIPYCLFSLLAGTFLRNAFEILALLTGVLAFWYVILPRRIAYDVGFLIVAAAPVMLRVFARIYRSPEDHLRIDILGHLMWIRLGIAALLILREWDPGAFGFWPKLHEWRLGLLYYLALLAPIIALALGVSDVRFEPLHGPWWRVVAVGLGTLFGALWVIALGEELFFRGVIERGLLKAWNSPVPAVSLSALLFGAAHLWFHQFPDWRHASVATLLGAGCGIAYWQSGSVRVPMVTHAFVIATWRVFFR